MRLNQEYFVQLKIVLSAVLLLHLPSMAIANDLALCNEAIKYTTNPASDPESLRVRLTPIVDACTRLLNGPKKAGKPSITTVLRGSAYYLLKEDDKALADFNAVITLYPGLDARFAYQNRANIRMDRGDYDGALSDMGEAIRLMPRNAQLYYNRALLWELKKDNDKAIADLEGALERDPKHDDALNSRGLLRLRRGDYDGALRDFNKVILLKPAYGHAYAIRGYFWRQRGDLDLAMNDLNKAVTLSDKSDSTAYSLRAEVHRYRGELDAALSDLNEASRREPDKALPILGRGLVLEKKGDLVGARVQFERVINLPRAYRANTEIDSAQARETAAARLASYDSGDVQPTIPLTPLHAKSATSIPTQAITTPIITKPLAADRLLASASQGRRVSLVIGNSAYTKVPALPNPQKDAEAVATSLRNIGFETVTLRNNATREELINALRAFAAEADKSDWAMVYYAGHGIEVNGINYLIPVDAVLASDRDVQFETVRLDQILSAMDGAKKLKLVVLDACRDNPFAPKMEKTAGRDVAEARSTAGGNIGTRSIGRGLGEVKVTGASLVVFAAKHGQTALDGEGANSPFAVALVQRIATPGVEINKIFRLVRDDVMEATAGRQEPYTYGSLPGKEDFYFVAGK
jgi:tetratricopeptide (TPR) repeat protein